MKVERHLLGALVAGLPLLTWGLLRPSLRRIAALHQRIQSAHAHTGKVPPYAPLGPGERSLLADPRAPWRARIPVVAGDAARMALVDRVVAELGASLKAEGVAPGACRAVFEPVRADFTLEPGPARSPWTAPCPPRIEDKLDGWVLEVEIAGGTAKLFQALAALGRVGPLLEPVGLRWTAAPLGARGKGSRRQVLLLRSYYLRP